MTAPTLTRASGNRIHNTVGLIMEKGLTSCPRSWFVTSGSHFRILSRSTRIFLEHGENSLQDSFQEHTPLDIKLMISFAFSFSVSPLSGSLMDHTVVAEVAEVRQALPREWLAPGILPQCCSNLYRYSVRQNANSLKSNSNLRCPRHQSL